MNRNFIDRFQYYRDSYLRARIKGDGERQRLWEIYSVAHPHFDDDKPHADSLLQQGANLARKLKEPCWELLFEFWQYEIDLNRADRLDIILKLFVKANQPKYRECTLLGDIYSSLLRAYLWHDPFGYEHEIMDGINYVLDSLPLPQDTFLIVMWTKMQLLLETGEFERILQTSKTYFRYCENQPTHLTWGYVVLVQAYYHMAEYILALNSAQDLEHAAANINNDSLVYTALKWQLTIYFKLDDQPNIHQISQKLRAYDVSTLSGYDALHEAQYEYDKLAFGWFGKFVIIRDSRHRIEGAHKANRPYLECKTRLRRLSTFLSVPVWLRWLMRWFARLPSVEAQVADAKVAAEKLTKPEPMLERIEAVANRKRIER